jgi:sodium/proline symporter
MKTQIAVTFILFLLLFTGVGIFSATKKQNTVTDYLLANRSVNPWLVALSAMATGQSGLLFIGQVGFAYEVGVSSLWLLIGWVIGDYLAWWFVFKKLRQQSESINADTVSAFLGQEKTGFRWITFISAVITLIFLSTYAAAQLIAGSKALNGVFGWNYELGIIIGAFIVAIYCFSGGIRASIWTDTVQAAIMIVSLVILAITALWQCGGFNGLWTSLNTIDPSLIDFSPPERQFGVIPFFFGWIVAGFGVVGQPHIIIRAMSINSPDKLGFTRNLKTCCGLINSLSATLIGLTARILLPDLLTNGDPEMALPELSLSLLPAFMVGLMLAGLFSATISTADSQILSCSAALTQDIAPKVGQSYLGVKIGTLSVTAFILAIALGGSNNVFAFVTFSWSALASGLGPLLILRVWQKSVSLPVALTMMGVGIAAALTWNLGLNFSSAIYEVFPGMLAGIAVYYLSRLLQGVRLKV